MKNDARFFFCFSGFLGFSIFYSTASVLHDNFTFTLVHGAIGCLCFAVYGRFLLSILLKSSIQSAPISSQQQSSNKIKSDPRQSGKRKTQPKQIHANENPHSKDIGEPMVNEKV